MSANEEFTVQTKTCSLDQSSYEEKNSFSMSATAEEKTNNETLNSSILSDNLIEFEHLFKKITADKETKSNSSDASSEEYTDAFCEDVSEILEEETNLKEIETEELISIECSDVLTDSSEVMMTDQETESNSSESSYEEYIDAYCEDIPEILPEETKLNEVKIEELISVKFEEILKDFSEVINLPEATEVEKEVETGIDVSSQFINASNWQISSPEVKYDAKEARMRIANISSEQLTDDLIGNSTAETMLTDNTTFIQDENDDSAILKSFVKPTDSDDLINFAEIESVQHETTILIGKLADEQLIDDLSTTNKRCSISEITLVDKEEISSNKSFQSVRQHVLMESAKTCLEQFKDGLNAFDKGKPMSEKNFSNKLISIQDENEKVSLSKSFDNPNGFEVKSIEEESLEQFSSDSIALNKGNLTSQEILLNQPVQNQDQDCGLNEFYQSEESTAYKNNLEKWKHIIVPIHNKIIVRLLCVHHIYKTKYWVTNENSYCDLIELERNMANNEFIPLNENAIECTNGELIATRINNRFHRAVIKRINKVKKLLQVYLIDWGARKTVDYSQVFEAQNFMKNAYAFSFLIELSDDLKFEYHLLLKIKLIRKRSNDNCVIAHLISRPPQPDIIPSSRTGPIEVKPHRIMNGGTCALFNLYGGQARNTFCWNFRIETFGPERYKSQHECGSIVLVNVRGIYWGRGRIISSLYKSGHYLVYLIDDGMILISKSLKMTTVNEAKYPAKKIYMITENNKPTFANLSDSDKILVVAISSPYDGNLLPCWMLINNVLKIKVFVTELPVLEQNYWIEPIRDGDLISISHVKTISEVCISAFYTLWYSDIFNIIEFNLGVFHKDETILIGEIVIVIRYQRNFSFRGKVVSINLENNTYNLLAIDFGYVVENVDRMLFRKSNLITNLFPITQKKVELSKMLEAKIDSKEDILEENKALQYLKKLSSRHVLYNIQYCNIRDNKQLIDIRQRFSEDSLIDSLIPFLSVKEEENIFEFHTFFRNFIPIDTMSRIYIANASTVLDGYIIGSSYHSDNELESFEDMQDYCCSLGRSHEIDKDLLRQICCVYNSEKDKWERAVFIKYSNNTATVINIDDYIVREVTAYDILPYHKSLPSLLISNQLFIKGFSDLSKNDRVILMKKLKLLTYVDAFVTFGEPIFPIIGKRFFYIILDFDNLLYSNADDKENNLELIQ